MKGPKIDDPVDRELTVDAIYVKFEALWFFDDATGRVAAKVPVSDSCSRPAP